MRATSPGHADQCSRRSGPAAGRSLGTSGPGGPQQVQKPCPGLADGFAGGGGCGSERIESVRRRTSSASCIGRPDESGPGGSGCGRSLSYLEDRLIGGVGSDPGRRADCGESNAMVPKEPRGCPCPDPGLPRRRPEPSPDDSFTGLPDALQGKSIVHSRPGIGPSPTRSGVESVAGRLAPNIGSSERTPGIPAIFGAESPLCRGIRAIRGTRASGESDVVSGHQRSDRVRDLSETPLTVGPVVATTL